MKRFSYYSAMKVECASSFVLLFVLCIVPIQARLELLHVFFRHGSRTPEQKDMYPNDPYTCEDFQPMGFGQLTNGGKQRAYALGKLLRKRYDHFLGALHTPEIALTTSTDFDRTKMTALLVLAGLFPPAPSQQWHENLSWNPIPYEMDKAAYDYFIRRPTAYCPAYLDELANVYASNFSAQIVHENRAVLNYIAEHAGRRMDTLMDAFRLYQTLNAEANMNMTLPKWTHNIYPDPISALAGMQCWLENSNDLLKRLNGGRMLGRVIDNMGAKIGDRLPPGRKIYLYSGHENNVINILAAMDLFDTPHVPKYSAAVIVELHRFDDQHAVKIQYVKDVHSEPEEQTLNGCDNLCPFDKFVDLTRRHVPVNYTAECKSSINLG